MTEHQRVRPYPVAIAAATAVVGVILGHWLAYSVVFSDPIARSVGLAATGHGYWIWGVRLAIVGGIVAAVAVMMSAVADRSGARSSGAIVVPSFRRLLVLQICGFTTMEAAERMVAGAPVAGMFTHDLFVVGVVLQVVTALIGAIGSDAIRAVRRPAGIAPSATTFVRPPTQLAGRGGLRGPPVLLGSFA